MLEPKQGAIALCTVNILGLITDEMPDEKGIWHGLSLEVSPARVKNNRKWSSSNPRVICYIDELKNITTLEDIKEARQIIKAHGKEVEPVGNGLYKITGGRKGEEYTISPLLVRAAREMQLKKPLKIEEDEKGRKRVRRIAAVAVKTRRKKIINSAKITGRRKKRRRSSSL